jgi:hypothetical protein
MSCHITVILGNGHSHDFALHDAELGMDVHQAQDWLGQEFEAAGCTPTNPVGKLLLADKILCLAKTQPPEAYAQPTPWVKEFLRAAACALGGRPLLTIDLARHALGY